MTPPLPVTEDTPADMLAGSMDLDIILPSGQLVRTSVLRSTPMMDLLIQETTAHRLSPGNYSLQAMGERGVLPYKPSTPIGVLDTFTVRIVEKKSTNLKKAPQIPQVHPTTFRLQINLPRSQLFVTRVSPQVTIKDILAHVCKEKCLDPNKYELRSTGNLGAPLDISKTLAECNTQQLSLIIRGSHTTRQLSSADIIHVKQSNNREKSVCDSSLSSGSLGSRSISPVTMSAPPQPPQRKKRRPAPQPPKIEQQSRPVLISHSRESSDSSGYHEPSTLSESPTHGVPPGMASRNSRSLSNLTSLPHGRLSASVSITSLSSNGQSKKKRAPPPPVQPQSGSNDAKVKSSSLPKDTRQKVDVSSAPISSPPVELAPSPPISPVDQNMLSQPTALQSAGTSQLPSTPPIPSPRTIINSMLRKPLATPATEKVKREDSVAKERISEEIENQKPTRSSLSSAFLLKRKLALDSKQNSIDIPDEDDLPSKEADQLNKPNFAPKPNAIKHLQTSQCSDSSIKNKPLSEIKKTYSSDDVDDVDFHTRSEFINPKTESQPFKSNDYDKDEVTDSLDSFNEKQEENVANSSVNNAFNSTTGETIADKVIEKLQISQLTEKEHEIKDSSRSRNQQFEDAAVPLYKVSLCKKKLEETLEEDQELDDFVKDNDGEQDEEVIDEKEEKDYFLESTKTSSKFGTFSKGFFRNMTFPEENRPTKKELSSPVEEHDSLNVDWQYQLPPPPTHFQDSASPDVTEFGTVTVNADIFDAATVVPKITTFINEMDEKLEETVNETINNYVEANGKEANDMEEIKKLTNACHVKKEELENSSSCTKIIGDCPPNEENSELKIIDTRDNRLGLKNGHKNEQIVLNNKSDVMLELTNVLNQNRIKERSQSYSNLTAPDESRLKKSHTLNYSQSFMNTPISNFRISNYDSETRHPLATDDMENGFKKPAPVSKGNAVRRSDSINIGTKSIDAETLQLEFLQFLQEKKLVDAGAELGNMDVTGILIKQVFAKDKKVEPVKEEEEKLYTKRNSIDVPMKKTYENKTEIGEELLQRERKPSDPVIVQVVPKSQVLEKQKSVDAVDNVVVDKNSIRKPSISKVEIKEQIQPLESPFERTKPIVPKPVLRRYEPPAVSMGTWGERPKTTVVIKDSDYITHDDVKEKSMPSRVPAVEPPKPVLEKKPVIQFKKPTHYELFSALPKKKDPLIIAAVQEKEEGIKADAKLPIVCGVELKKGFRSEPDLIQGLKTEKMLNEEPLKSGVTKTNLNGYCRNNDVPTQTKVSNNSVPRPNLVPVVRGFRDVVKESYSSSSNKSETISRQESMPATTHKTQGFISRHDSLPVNLNVKEPVRNHGIPPPPPLTSIMLKPVNNRPIKPKTIDDPRGQLLEEIRSFDGRSRLRKTVQ